MLIRRFIPVFLLILVMAGTLLATTWGQHEVVCPICKTKNTFQAPMSFGGYIYRWPSKFHLIFWPVTDGQSLYHCKKCRYSAFMGDFDKLPADRSDAVRTVLKDVPPVHVKGDYTAVSMIERLEIAEKVYRVWEQDDHFWCFFHRVKGYHLEHAKKPEEASAQRRKALAIARKMLEVPARAGERKELLIITGAMQHFLKDDSAALIDFTAASSLVYKNSKRKDEQNKNWDKYLDQLVDEYISAILEGRSTEDKP